MKRDAALADFMASFPRLWKRNAADPVTWTHYLLIGVSLVATLVAWRMSLAGVEERTRLQFDSQAAEVIRVFEEQMHRYEDVLLAGVGFVAGSDRIRPDEWQEFTQRMAWKQRHPALSSMGVLHKVLPEEIESFELEQRTVRAEFSIQSSVDADTGRNGNFLLPLTHVVPRVLENNALGLDAMRESRRRSAIERAMDSGQVQITEAIRLSRDQKPGLLLFAPIYHPGVIDTVEQRRARFRGAIAASIFTQDLAAGLVDSERRQVVLKVSDAGEVLYNEQLSELADIDPQPLLSRSREMEFMGRIWRFDVDSTMAFRKAQHRLEPTLILFGGLIINALLMYLLFNMAQANRHATDFGRKLAARYDQQSQALRHSNKALEALNEELRSFSYVVSHDLKTPLRGIAGLTHCIEDDLEEQFPGINASKPEFPQRLQLIRKQVNLAQGLITGVLEYSGLGADVEYPETVDVRELLRNIQGMLAVDDAQLQLVDEFPVFETYQTQLFQVFMNLIGNGFKYNSQAQTARVTVSHVASRRAGFHRFVVSDNGPGIDARDHERIFEVFSTLQPKDHSMSSGVGLAIVRKLVIRHGGEVGVDSEPGHGASFWFDWPCEVGQAANEEIASTPKAA